MVPVNLLGHRTAGPWPGGNEALPWKPVDPEAPEFSCGLNWSKLMQRVFYFLSSRLSMPSAQWLQIAGVLFGWRDEGSLRDSPTLTWKLPKCFTQVKFCRKTVMINDGIWGSVALLSRDNVSDTLNFFLFHKLSFLSRQGQSFPLCSNVSQIHSSKMVPASLGSKF